MIVNEASSPFILEVLHPKHLIHVFDCGDEEINTYLYEDALKDMQRDTTRTFVEIDTGKPTANNVAGFFTIRADAFKINEDHFVDWEADDDGKSAVSIPEIKVPLVELVNLARGLAWRGMGIGDVLMIDALKKVCAAADCIGLIGLHLRTTSQGKILYERFDFEEFTAHPERDQDRYILRIETIRTIVERAPSPHPQST